MFFMQCIKIAVNKKYKRNCCIIKTFLFNIAWFITNLVLDVSCFIPFSSNFIISRSVTPSRKLLFSKKRTIKSIALHLRGKSLLLAIKITKYDVQNSGILLFLSYLQPIRL